MFRVSVQLFTICENIDQQKKYVDTYMLYLKLRRKLQGFHCGSLLENKSLSLGILLKNISCTTLIQRFISYVLYI